MEQWKDIEGYEGLYQICNDGKVKSLERYIKHSKGGLKLWKERILKPSLQKGGYLFIVLSKEGKTIPKTNHLLVWDHFGSGKRNGHKLQVDHIDENKLNNHIDNLQLLNVRSNVSKSIDKTKTTSKYIGVNWNKKNNKWRSQIRYKGNRKHLGYFENEYDAHLAYKKELEKYA